jgi:hypothetical protein
MRLQYCLFLLLVISNAEHVAGGQNMHRGFRFEGSKISSVRPTRTQLLGSMRKSLFSLSSPNWDAVPHLFLNFNKWFELDLKNKK